MRQYAIIGCGVAGIAACEAIRSQDPDAAILLLSDDPFGFYSRPGIAFYLTGELPERSLFPFHPKELGVRLVQKRVEKILPDSRQLALASGEKLRYDRLLVATGSSATRLGLPNDNLPGVVKLDTLGDARQILALRRGAHSAVVVGGGIIALELVEGLRSRGLKVHYFLRGERYWNAVLDETESHIVEERLKEEKVEMHYRTEIAEILGKKGRIAGVRTKAGELVPCEILAVGIGIRPRMELAQQAGLKTERGILVDERLQTSQAGIYAAGDVAQVFDPAAGSYVLDSLWDPARQQGLAAGLNMAGKDTRYRKEMAFNVTRLAGLTTTIIGLVGSGRDEDLLSIARGDSETWRRLPGAIAAQAHFEVNNLRILIGKNTILGAVVMGDQTLSQPLRSLISSEADISPIRDRMLQPSAPLGNLIADFYTEWKNHDALHRAGTPPLQS